MINLSPPRARGSGFIVPSSEREPLDQTDIDWTVILGPLGRWSLVREESSESNQTEGWHPGQLGGQCLAPFGLRVLLVASRVF